MGLLRILLPEGHLLLIGLVLNYDDVVLVVAEGVDCIVLGAVNRGP
jgi:hypothetical protein